MCLRKIEATKKSFLMVRDLVGDVYTPRIDYKKFTINKPKRGCKREKVSCRRKKIRKGIATKSTPVSLVNLIDLPVFLNN